MNDKTIHNLLLSGNAITLKLRNGALRKFKELSGKDPLELLSGGTTIDRIDFAEYVVKAGMLAHNPQTDITKVTAWIDDASMEQTIEIIKAFTAAYAPEEKPATTEGGTDTQQAADSGGHVP
jgi:hypothetical protein